MERQNGEDPHSKLTPNFFMMNFCAIQIFFMMRQKKFNGSHIFFHNNKNLKLNKTQLYISSNIFVLKNEILFYLRHLRPNSDS
jgi:hypothetical protein